MTRSFVVLVAFAYFGCSGDQTPAVQHFYDIDSLITAQVQLLNAAGHQLSKRAIVGQESTTVVIKPDSAGWASELAVFRQLEIAGRPTNRDRYRIQDLPDPGSNLRIRSYEGKDTPVPVIRFYYLDGPGDVRRIESRYTESNKLYTSTRTLLMEFEEHDSKSTLRRYKVDGFQKILMGDSVHFSIDGDVL